MAERPGRQVGLTRKGRIAVGADADLAVFAPDEAFVVDPARLHHRHPVTPYAGGPCAASSAGRGCAAPGSTSTDEPRGRLLTRGEHERWTTT